MLSRYAPDCALEEVIGDGSWSVVTKRSDAEHNVREEIPAGSRSAVSAGSVQNGEDTLSCQWLRYQFHPLGPKCRFMENRILSVIMLKVSIYAARDLRVA